MLESIIILTPPEEHITGQTELHATAHSFQASMLPVLSWFRLGPCTAQPGE